MANKANLEATLAAIEANPQHWDQSSWHCGTSHCFAGFAEMLRLNLEPTHECSVAPLAWRDDPDEQDAERMLANSKATREWLGLDEWEWESITEGHNTLADIRRMVKTGIFYGPEDTDDEDDDTDFDDEDFDS